MTKFTQITLSSPGKFNSLGPREQERTSELKEGEVRVSVKYSGLNFADIMMRLGLYPDAPKAPFCPGYEISGTVAEVGANVKDLKSGDHVMAGTYFGGQSSEVVVPSWQVQKLPMGFDLKTAAALPVSGLTCDLALGELARVKKEDKVMIDCGSGALGALMISYLKYLGNETIIGLTSKQEKCDIIKERGATAMLLDDWLAHGPKVDVIINSRGGRSLKEDRSHLNPLGRMVALGASHMVSKGGLSYLNVVKEFLGMEKVNYINLMHANQGVMGLNVLRLFERPEVLKRSLVHISELAASNVLVPAVDKVFKAENVEEAYDYLGQGKSRGKVLLSWDH